MIQTWRLDGECQSLILGAEQQGLPKIIHWGAKLPLDEDLAALFLADRLDVTGGMLDQLPDLSICPSARQSFPGHVGLKLRDQQGKMLSPKFSFASEEVSADQIVLSYADQDLGLTYQASFKIVVNTGVVESQAKLISGEPVLLQWLVAPVIPAPHSSSEFIDFAGRWCGEFQMQSNPWRVGAHIRDNKTGRTGHEYFPAVLLPVDRCTNTQGQVYGLHYGWSGGHKMVAEELPDGRRQIQFGHAEESELKAGTSFKTAPLYMTYSETGLNGCAVAYQRHLRDHILDMPHPDHPRPVHYNCWESVYFDHDLDELKGIANRAADLGAERFVLDDGWFGLRDDDHRALGDWTVDPRKYPDGLSPLIDHVQNLGMTFGIWFEPEMINEDSDLYRAHSDWVLGPSDQVIGRQQLVLNMALPEVRDYLYEVMAAILKDCDIDYIKWDHNRVLPYADADQIRGTYTLLDRLRNDFSSVEIESCASGGGRIDFGILKRTHRVWLSDSNDAIERTRIQHNAALFLPSIVTGSHVGPRKCHTSGRILDMDYRAWVAAQRHMGFEMDPRELTDDEAAKLKSVTSWWKENRNWLACADILRLDSPDPSVIGEIQVAEDGQQFVAFINKIDTSDQISPRPIRLTGLEADQRYKIELVNRAEIGNLSRGETAFSLGEVSLSGAILMNKGISLPWSFPASVWVLQGVKE